MPSAITTSAFSLALQPKTNPSWGLRGQFSCSRDNCTKTLESPQLAWFHENIEAGVTYANRPQGATTGAWPGYQPFGGWKGSGSTGKAIASFYYLPLYLREQSRTVVE